MKILKIHIDNFGKLADLNLDFDEGLNAWQEENGFGKTTLATFIAVMLYGFLDEKGRKLPGTSQRSRYLPWQGGKYGGNLVFQTDEGTFTIVRDFADSPVRDRLEVLDRDGMRTGRFGKIPGLTLFGIDGESFLRTIFICDNDLRASVPDDVSARLGNLLDDAMDMNRYEDALGRLKHLTDAMNPRKTNGSISRDKAAQADLKQRLRGKPQAEDNYARLNARARELKAEARNDLAAKKVTDEKIRALVNYNAVLAERNAYESLKAEKVRRTQEYDRVRNWFPHSVPTEQELQKAQEALRTAEKQEQTIRDSALTEGDKKIRLKADACFRSSTVLEGETEEMYRVCGQIRDLLQEKNELQKELLTRRAQAAERKQREADEARTRAEEEAVRLAKLDLQKKHRRAAGIAAAVMGGILVILSLLTAVGKSKTDGHLSFSFDELPVILFLIAGVLALFAGIFLILSARKKNDAREDLPGRTEVPESSGEEPEDAELEKLGARIRETEAAVSAEEQKVRAYFGRFGISYDDNRSRAEEIVSALDQLKKAEEQVRVKENRGTAARETYEAALAKVRRFLTSLGFTPEPDLHEQLEGIEDRLGDLIQAGRELNQATDALKMFEEEHDTGRLLGAVRPDFPETLEELQTESKALQEQAREKTDSAGTYAREAEELERKLDGLREDEETLQELSRKIDADSRRYDLLIRTQDCLRQAKLSLSRKYASPVTERFRTYLSAILAEGQEDFRVDPEGNVLVEDRNEPRQIAAYSHGYRDLTYFCMRIALIDSMYREEKPPVILDDPFVNLDDAHAARAIALVREIAKEYQVFYFTCSEGRKA